MKVVFYATWTGREPVREWLQSLQKDEKKQIGEDIKTIQFGWPIGMPVVEKLDRDLWEVRTVMRNKIARVLFTIYENQIVLLHGFIKKNRKISVEDLALAQQRLGEIKRG
ncbi:MAG: type II toxin-antitoxin system RelE/ParE family toxin [Candidatus Omnitrophica bacterium]|nr:type II toxin-antitoxin system RelE/ParE family toxin [Candidatus Omnitrophota bacterium]